MRREVTAGKKSPQEFPSEWLEAYDTGIYHDPPKQYYPLKTQEDWQAFRRRSEEQAAERFDLDRQMAEAEQFAQKVRDRDRPLYLSMSPSHTRAQRDGIADNNIERRVRYAQHTLAYVRLTRERIKDGDCRKACVYGCPRCGSPGAISWLNGTVQLFACRQRCLEKAKNGHSEQGIEASAVIVWALCPAQKGTQLAR